jgi:hypothetical protein
MLRILSNYFDLRDRQAIRTGKKNTDQENEASFS